MVIDMWTVVFSRKLYDKLDKFLFSNTPYENGCFLLANSYKTKNKSILLVTKIIKPTDSSWNKIAKNALEPSSSYINECVIKAESTNSSLIFVHTHPDVCHPATFSFIDEKSNSRMFSNISQILQNRAISSMVFSQKGICGVVFEKNHLQDINKIKIVGTTLIEFSGVGYEKEHSENVDAEFDRQVRALGKHNQKRLQDIKVTIVGLGGTGSPIAIQLAKMGIVNIQLIDMDRIDVTNLPRVYGSSNADVGEPKAMVVKKYIKTFSKSNIHAICDDVTDSNMREHLIESDVIFACTDNLTSRSVLNEISHRYYIPLIDVGCRINLDDDGLITQAIAKVQVVTPDSACLWCTGTLDGKTILQESFTKEEKQQLAKEGYYDGIEKQPSVISLTTMAASLAVNKVLSLIGTFGVSYNTRTQIEIKGGFMIDDTPKIKENCICKKNSGIGR